MWTRSELKNKAKIALKRSYWGLVLLGLIFGIISGGGGGGYSGFNNARNTGDGESAQGIQNIFSGAANGADMAEMLAPVLGVVAGVMLVAILVGVLLAIFVFYPLQIGCYRYLEEASYEQRTVSDLGLLGFAFKNGRYGNVVKNMFLMELFVFLWSLLFIIPGIIKTYEYRMIPFILAENPDLDTKQVFALSKEMMTGNKWASFVLDLSFIGWIFLTIFTCGILAIFYVTPYMLMTDAYLYDTLKQNASIDYFDRTLGGQAAYAGGYSAPTGDYQTFDDSDNTL